MKFMVHNKDIALEVPDGRRLPAERFSKYKKVG